LDRKDRITCDEIAKATAYIAKLELWASTIRFKRNSEEKRELEQVLLLLKLKLQDAIARADWEVRFRPCTGGREGARNCAASEGMRRRQWRWSGSMRGK
jgi:hypothetical protein